MSDASESVLRLFAAVPVQATPKLCAFLERLRRLGTAVKVADPTHLHLTVKFFGDVAEGRVSELANALADSVRQFPAVPYRLVGLQAFPRRERPRVLYAPIHERSGNEAFAALASRFERSCESIGFARERRPFVAHVTLARIKDRPPPQWEPLVREGAAVDFGDQVASETVLFRSILERSGPTYHRLSSAAFVTDT